MEKMVEMSETMVYPSYDLGLSGYARGEAGRIGSGGAMGGGETFPTRTEASMGAGLPKMPWFGVDDAYVKEIRVRTEGMRNELRMEEVRTELEVRRAWAEADRALREESLYADRLVALSRASMEAAGAGYTAGTQMFADVLERYVAWYEANERLERARADLGIAAARLDAAAGVALSSLPSGK
jgi:outer membrane protein TolC